MDVRDELAGLGMTWTLTRTLRERAVVGCATTYVGRALEKPRTSTDRTPKGLCDVAGGAAMTSPEVSMLGTGDVGDVGGSCRFLVVVSESRKGGEHAARSGRLFEKIWNDKDGLWDISRNTKLPGAICNPEIKRWSQIGRPDDLKNGLSYRKGQDR